jgi:putative DNA primase/helicase
MALCNILAYWCSGPEQIDRIFRSSGLMRDKWDSPRGKSTYGFTTIEAAMSMRVIGPSTEAS